MEPESQIVPGLLWNISLLVAYLATLLVMFMVLMHHYRMAAIARLYQQRLRGDG